MAKIKLGLIGLGYIGKVHLRNCLRLANANLEAVADLSKKALSDAKKAGVKKTYTDYQQLLKDPNVDAVIIALPTHLHLECTKHAAEAQKHILLEKPLAKNVEEAKEIVSRVQRNSVRLMMAYPLRFLEATWNQKEQFKSGALGDVVVAYATYVSTGPFMHRSQDNAPVPVPEWWLNKDLTGGGALIDLGSHVINLLRWYLGEIVDIKSYLGYRFNMNFEDHAICLAQFGSGTTAIINVGWFSQKYQLKVDLIGTAEHAIFNHTIPNRIVFGLQMLTNTSTFWRPYLVELNYFVNCIANDKQPHPSGSDGLRDLQAIELAYTNSFPLKAKK
jgi:predicted dehydrogenase